VSVALLVMTDGRDDELTRAIESASVNLDGPVTRWYVHDDTGDEAHRAWVGLRWPFVDQIGAGPRRGFGGAIAYAWSVLAVREDIEFVFHLEDDFVFSRPVDLAAMASALAENSHLAQLALRRQPWNAAESAAGGIVEQHPESYHEISGGADGWSWLEHRRFWTTNPCLYRRELCAVGWPAGRHSEGHFGIGLFRDGLPWGVPGGQVRAAFWGARDSGEWVEHIGHQRVGTGY
jgi:hypothetical protein